jgi:hypothetical protein
MKRYAGGNGSVLLLVGFLTAAELSHIIAIGTVFIPPYADWIKIGGQHKEPAMEDRRYILRRNIAVGVVIGIIAGLILGTIMDNPGYGVGAAIGFSAAFIITGFRR